MPPRPCPQARDRTRATSWPPPQAAPLDGTVDSPSATAVVGLVHPHIREVHGLLLTNEPTLSNRAMTTPLPRGGPWGTAHLIIIAQFLMTAVLIFRRPFGSLFSEHQQDGTFALLVSLG